MNGFAQAKKIVLYEIDGKLYERVPAEQALRDPLAIRATLPITKGEDAGGLRVVWFKQVAGSPTDEQSTAN